MLICNNRNLIHQGVARWRLLGAHTEVGWFSAAATRRLDQLPSGSIFVARHAVDAT